MYVDVLPYMAILERVVVFIVRLNDDSWQYLLCASLDKETKWGDIRADTLHKEKAEDAVRRILMDDFALSPMILINTGLEIAYEPTEEEQLKYEEEIETIYQNVFIVRVSSTIEPILNLEEYKKYQWFPYKEALKLLQEREQEALRYCKNILEE